MPAFGNRQSAYSRTSRRGYKPTGFKGKYRPIRRKRKRRRIMRGVKLGKKYKITRSLPFKTKKVQNHLMKLEPISIYPNPSPNTDQEKRASFVVNDPYRPLLAGEWGMANANRIGFFVEEMLDSYNHGVCIAMQCFVKAYNPSTQPIRLTLDLTGATTGQSISGTTRLMGGTAKQVTILPGKFGILRYNVNPNQFLGIAAPTSDHQVNFNKANGPIEKCYLECAAESYEQTLTSNNDRLVCEFWLKHVCVYREPRINTVVPTRPTSLEDYVVEPDSVAATLPDHTHTYTDHDDMEHGTGTPNVTETSGPNVS